MLNVSDNGPGAEIQNGQLPPSKSGGVGLHNIHDRLKSLYVDNYSFVISHNYPSGIKVNIRIPCEKSENASEQSNEN